MGALQLVLPDKFRTADQDFLQLVKVHYREIAAQMKGLLWKDGGPVVAVQFDNESNDLPYLFALKKIARELGVDVPFYCMTGWGQSLPKEDLIPLCGGYADGFWPVNLDCAGVRLNYATAQLIARLEADGQHWFFFAANEGIVPEFAFGNETPRRCKTGLGVAFTRRNSNGAKVNFLVVSSDQGSQFWKLPLAGRDRVVLSSQALLADSEDQIRLESLGDEPPHFALFPELKGVRLGVRAVRGQKLGVFTEYALHHPWTCREPRWRASRL